MNVAKQKYIFGLEGSAHSSFKIYPTEATNGGKLRALIEFSGGACAGPDQDGPFVIPIVDLRWCKENNRKIVSIGKTRDVFSSKFISDCYIKEKLMDLNLYKLNDSRLTEYDANLILKRELSWNDVKVVTTTVDRNETLVDDAEKHNSSQHTSKRTEKGNGSTARDKTKDKNKTRPALITTPSQNNQSRRESSIESVDSDDSIKTMMVIVKLPPRSRPNAFGNVNSTISASSDSGPTRAPLDTNTRDKDNKRPHSGFTSSSTAKKKGRRPYHDKESKAILKYICDHELHFLTGGNEIWKKMEKAKILEGRTDQSMKEHFRKQIFPRLDDWDCSERDKHKFSRAEKVRNGGRRRPGDYHYSKPTTTEKV